VIPIPFVADLASGWYALTVSLAAIPAIVSWWRGRALLNKGEDPALPELLDSRRRTTMGALAIALALMIVLTGAQSAWGIPLLAVLLIAVGYPVRRRILGETWGFWPYLYHTARSIVGGFGFWIALAYAPTMVEALLDTFGTGRWWLAIPVAAALLAWEHWYPAIWLWAHDARRLTHPNLVARFDEIVRRAATVVPDVYSVGPKGSRFVNAVALPSVRRARVAMGDALLELLDEDETAAIFAHEMAHFDHLNPRWLRRTQLVTRSLIVAGVAAPVAAALFAPNASSWVGWVWPIAMLIVLLQRAARSQQHETESDLRAAALCGDPEALVRALAKLHLHARVPRRWAVDVERVASHPSLVRRIQAIRGGGAAAVEQLGNATVLRSPRDGSWVVFDDTRAHWLDGVALDTVAELAPLRDAASNYRAVNYADLAELRVTAAGNDRAIVARTRGGDSWTVPIAVDDVARVQRTLDIVDVRLGRATAATQTPLTSRFLGATALLVAMLAGQTLVMLVPAALAFWKPGPAALAALGAMSLVRAAFGAIERNYGYTPEIFTVATVALAVIGIVAFVAVFRQRRAGGQPLHWRVTVGVLGGAAALVAVAVAGVVWQSGTDAITTAGVPLIGVFATMLFGLAAVMLMGTPSRTRQTGYGTLVVAAALAVLGIDRTWLALRDAMAEVPGTLAPAGVTELGSAASGLRLSPNGERFLVLRLPLNRRAATTWTQTLTVGQIGGATRDVRGIAGDFVDDARILVLDALDEALEVRLERADTIAPPLWADTIVSADIEEPRLIIDRDASEWSVAGASTDTQLTTMVSGRIGEKGTTVQIPLPDSLAMIGEPVVFGTTNSLVLPAYTPMTRGTAPSILSMALLGMSPLRTELWRVAGTGVQRVVSLRGVPQCGEPLDGAAACVVRESNALSFYSLTADGVATEIGRRRGADLGVMAVGPGLHAASMAYDRSMLIVDIAARRMTRAPLPEGSEFPAEVRSASGYAVALGYSENRRTTVRRYRISPQ
jgi:Zn-dependent protease with chaperone function